MIDASAKVAYQTASSPSSAKGWHGALANLMCWLAEAKPMGQLGRGGREGLSFLAPQSLALPRQKEPTNEPLHHTVPSTDTPGDNMRHCRKAIGHRKLAIIVASLSSSSLFPRFEPLSKHKHTFDSNDDSNEHSHTLTLRLA